MSILSKIKDVIIKAIDRDRRCKKASVDLEVAIKELEAVKSRSDCTEAKRVAAEKKVDQARTALDIARAK